MPATVRKAGHAVAYAKSRTFDLDLAFSARGEGEPVWHALEGGISLRNVFQWAVP